MKQVTAIVDLQFGSTGKGLLAGYLAKRINPDVVCTAWAPNAGHTFIDEKGIKFVNIALPNAIVSPSVKVILLGPGSVINPQQLVDEIYKYEPYLDGKRIMIHPYAGVVTQEHRDRESQYGFKIGSTMKGVGEAVIDKIRRNPDKPSVAMNYDLLEPFNLEGLVCSIDEYNEIVNDADHILIEGAQGFSLSINQGFYPYTTSRDCTVHQLLSDCAIPRIRDGALPGTAVPNFTVWGTARTYPIRVANRFDAEGNQIGTSGPCYTDQEELAWCQIGREPELTTVTKLPRRLFTFSEQQIAHAIHMNGVDRVFLNFCNYNTGVPDLNTKCIDAIKRAGATVSLTGWGPTEQDVMEGVNPPWHGQQEALA